MSSAAGTAGRARKGVAGQQSAIEQMIALALSLAVCLAGCAKLFSIPAWKTADAIQHNRRLGRGINLGNPLEAPNEGLWRVTLRQK